MFPPALRQVTVSSLEHPMKPLACMWAMVNPKHKPLGTEQWHAHPPEARGAD